MFFSRSWDEPRGDAYDAWGTSVWYLEVGDDGYPRRQLEAYQSGDTLAYDEGHLDDEYGGLGDQPIDGEEWASFEIGAAEFEAVWSAAKPRNRPVK